MIKKYLHYAVAAALLAASATSNLAFAVEEVESDSARGCASNDSLNCAQPLVIGRDGVEVSAVLGAQTIGLPLLPDVDFYSFKARAGEKLNVDIDFGAKLPGSSLYSLDSVIAVFRPDGTVLRDNDDNPGPAAD